MKDSGECPRPPFVKAAAKDGGVQASDRRSTSRREVIRKNDRGIFKELGISNE